MTFRNVLLALATFAVCSLASAQAIRNPSTFPPPGGAGVDLCPGEDPCNADEIVRYDSAASCWKCADVLSPAASTSNARLNVGTADGADNSGLVVSGGGTEAAGEGGSVDRQRGGGAYFGGNEHATYPGHTYIYPGLVNTGRVHITDTSGGGFIVRSVSAVSGEAAFEFGGTASGLDRAIYLDQTMVSGIKAEGATLDAFELYLKFPDVAADRNITLPGGAPTNNYAVKTDGSGVWAYADADTLVDGSGSTCISGEYTHTLGAIDTGGFMCKNGATPLALTTIQYITTPSAYASTDNDAANAVDDANYTYWWNLGMADSSSTGSGVEDNVVNGVISIMAGEGTSATAQDYGPYLSLWGGDTENDANVPAGNANSAVLGNGNIDSTISGANRGGFVQLYQNNTYGFLCALSRTGNSATDHFSVFGQGDMSDAAIQCLNMGMSPAVLGATTFGDVFLFAHNDVASLGAGAASDSPIYFNNIRADTRPTFIFEGPTQDVNETFVTVKDPTADRTIVLPNASGTVAVSASSPITLSAAGDIACPTCSTGANLWTDGTNGHYDNTESVLVGPDAAADADISGVSEAGDLRVADAIQVGGPIYFTETPSGIAAATADAADSATTFIVSGGVLDTSGNRGAGATFVGNEGASSDGKATIFSGNAANGAATAAVELIVKNSGGSDVSLNVDTDSFDFTGSATTQVYYGTGIDEQVIEGATADAFETTMSWADPTADHTQDFPDADGHVQLYGLRRTFGVYVRAGSVTMDAWGNQGGSIAGTGTAPSTADDADGIFLNIQTTASSGTSQTYSDTNTSGFRADWLPDITYRVKTDASAVTSVTYWAGLSSATVAASDTPTAHMAAFRYATAAGDANWQFCTNDNTSTPTCSDTGVAVAANTAYTLRLEFSAAGTAKAYVNGVLKATRTTDMPTSSASMYNQINCRNTSASIRSLKWGRYDASMQ